MSSAFASNTEAPACPLALLFLAMYVALQDLKPTKRRHEGSLMWAARGAEPAIPRIRVHSSQLGDFHKALAAMKGAYDACRLLVDFRGGECEISTPSWP